MGRTPPHLARTPQHQQFVSVSALAGEQYVEIQAQAREVERRVLLLERTLTREEVLKAGVFALGLQAFIASGRAWLVELAEQRRAAEQVNGR